MIINWLFTATAVLFALKITGLVSIGWGVVFFPVIVFLSLILLITAVVLVIRSLF